MLERLRVDSLIYDGRGLAHVEGTSEFVRDGDFPFLLPGELIEASPGKQITILEPSADRVSPTCIHFGTCGGCHYQHAAYPAQIRIKQAVLADAFKMAKLNDLPAVAIHSAEPWQYRNRIRLRAGEESGELRFGYNRRVRPSATGQPPFLAIAMCPIAAPILWQAASTLLELGKTDANIHSWLAAASELELFTNADETSLQLTLFTRKLPLTSFAIFCAAVQRAIPQLAGAGVAFLPKKLLPQGRRLEQPRPGPQWGSPGLLYRVADDNHWIGRGGFFQVNRFLVSKLADLVTASRSGNTAWDLYAGAGLFSRALTRSFGQVTGVEAAEPACASLAAALKPPHRAVQMTTLEFLQAAAVQRDRPDLIVLDPPRAGAGTKVCELLARIGAPEVVYVSCMPMTLVRDLMYLTAAGYKATELHLVDMFPQTFHMETVAILRRS